MNASLHAKFKATSIHLFLSMLLFIAIALWIYNVLYPSFYFNMSGGRQGLALMFFVDIILGPLLTFMVFNPNKSKRETYLDLGLVSLVQISALTYGMSVIYNERPKLLIIYQYGNATVVSAREIKEDSQLKHLKYKNLPKLESIPVVVYRINDSKSEYAVPMNASKELIASSNIAQLAITDTQNSSPLNYYSKQSTSPIWVFAVMGKYTGAYIVTNPEWEYLGKLGEKPIY